MSKIELLIQAQDQASKQIAAIESEMKKLTAGSKNLGSAFGGLNGIVKTLIGAASLGALKGVLMNVMGAFAESEAQMAKVDAILNTLSSKTLKNVGMSMDQLKSSIDGVSQANIKLGFDDEDTATSVAKLTAATGDYKEALYLNNMAMDLSRYKNIDLGTATEVLIKVQAGQTRVLKELGIQTKEGISTQEAFAIVMQKTKGQAEAYANTVAGKTDMMKVSFQNLKETLGGALAPAFKKIIDSVQPLIEQFTKRAEKNPKLTEGLILVGGGLTAVVGIMAVVGPIASKAVAGIKEMSGAFGGLYAAAATAGVAVGNFFAKALNKAADPGGWLDRLDHSNYNKNGDYVPKTLPKTAEAVSPATADPIVPPVDLSNFKMPNMPGGAGAESSAIKEQKKAIEDLAKSMKEMGFVQDAVTEASISAKKLDKNAIEELGTYYKSLQKHAQESFDGINDKIKTSTEKIFDYKQSIIDLNKQINDLKGEQNTDVAKSYVESVQKIKQLQSEINSGSASSDASAQLAAEQANIQSAFAGLSDAEKATLQAKIDKETEYQAMTGIEKIRADSSEKIALIQAEIAEKTKGIADETAKLTELNTQKATLEKNRMNTLKLDHTAQVKMYDELIAKARELASARSSVGVSATTPTPAVAVSGKKALGGSVNGGSTYLVGEVGPELFTPAVSGYITPNDKIGGANVSINLGGVVINNEADENKLVEKISNALTRQIDLYKLGVY